MKVADLSPETMEHLKAWRYDRIIEKHEGPFGWADKFEFGEPEFLEIDGQFVLLPLDAEQRPHVTILRCIESKDDDSLTIFLKDTTYVDSPDDEFFMAGFFALCERFPGENFFVATWYHEWFMETNQN